MQKKIIVLAIAGALSAPALALADNTYNIYGVIDASYDFVTTGDGQPSNPSTKGVSTRRVSSNASRLGVKGSDDLGNGISAIWQLEGTVGFGSSRQYPMNNPGSYPSSSQTDTPSVFALDRDTFAGLSSASIGTVLIGRHDTPYKMATRNLDVFADSIADNRSLMGGASGLNGDNLQYFLNTSSPTNQGGISSVASFDDRPGNVLAYVSPTFSGVSVAVALVDLTAQNTQNDNNQHKVTATSLAGMYDMGPIYAAAAYETHTIKWANNWNNADIKESAEKVGVGYKMDMFAVGFVYEKTSDDAGSGWVGAPSKNLLGHNAWTLNGKFNISATDTVKAAYTKTGQIGDTANCGANCDTAAKQFSLGYDHSMSKRTTVYALYTKLSNGADGSYGLYNGNYNNVNVTGASPSALSLGVKVAF